MKKLLLLLTVLCGFSIRSTDPLRFEQIKVTVIGDEGQMQLRYDFTVTGGTEGYTYSLSGEPDVGPISSATASFTTDVPPSLTYVFFSVVDGSGDTISGSSQTNYLEAGLSPGAFGKFTYTHPANCSGSDSGAVLMEVSGTDGIFSVNFSEKFRCMGKPSCTVEGLSDGPLIASANDRFLDRYNPFNIATMLVALTGNVKIDGIDKKDPLCLGETNGSIVVTASADNLPLTYTLNDRAPQKSNVFTGLAAGDYSVAVTDAAYCTSNSLVTLTDPLPLSLTAGAKKATCGKDNGSITVTITTGGNAPYRYSLNSGDLQDSPVFTGLAPDVYTIEVTDAYGCTAVAPGVVESSEGVVISSLAKTDPLCLGAFNGTITVTAMTGNPPLWYSLHGGTPQRGTPQRSNTFTGLGAGTYMIKVEDNAFCTAQGRLTLTDPLPMRIEVLAKTTTCGEDNGAITVTTVRGGTAPYRCSLNSGKLQDSPVFTGLAPAVYTVGVTDANGCTVAAPGVVKASERLTIKVETESPTCPGISDGLITVFVLSSGSDELNYMLTGEADHMKTSDTGHVVFTGLPAGSYRVQVIAKLGSCTAQMAVELPAVSPINFSLPKATSVTCKCADNGTILLRAEQVTGGTAPYTYSIGTKVGFIPVGELFRWLQPGLYEVIVMDADGCISVSEQVVVEAAESIKICTVLTTPATCPDFHNGTLYVKAKSKVPLQYAINGSKFQESPLFEGLAPGKYRVAVNRKGDDSSECVICYARIKKKRQRF